MNSRPDMPTLAHVLSTLSSFGFNNVCVDDGSLVPPTSIKGFIPHATAYYGSRFFIVETVTSAAFHYEDTPQRHSAFVEAVRQRRGIFVAATIGSERIFADAVLALIDPLRDASRVWHYRSTSLGLPKV